MKESQALEEINKLKQDIQNFQLQSPSDLTGEVVKSWEIEDNPLTTTFECFDNVLKNKLRGKLGLFIGKGGCKKSLFAQQISKKNSVNGHRSIYSTMEMPATQLVERLIDMSFTDDENNFYGYNASYFLEKEYQREPEQIKSVVENGLKSMFGDKFMISRKSRMTASDYESLIIAHNKKYKEPVSILIVDGLSMMGGDKGEKDDYTTNSGQLKDLANKYNIFIALICHVTKICTRHQRNTSDYIRGSEKILDNCDFLFQLSLCQDESSINGDECEYSEDLGYIRLYDKRGSGTTKDIIYKFDKQKLELKESILEPYIFNFKDKSKKF